MMTSAHFADLGDVADLAGPRPSPCRATGCRRQPDLHADAAVLQVQRVRVALRSVADHRDLLAANEREVRVRVVVHLAAIEISCTVDLKVRTHDVATWPQAFDACGCLDRIVPEVLVGVDRDVATRATAGPLGAPVPRAIATRPVRTISMTPYGLSTSSKPSILSSVPVLRSPATPG